MSYKLKIIYSKQPFRLSKGLCFFNKDCTEGYSLLSTCYSLIPIPLPLFPILVLGFLAPAIVLAVIAVVTIVVTVVVTTIVVLRIDLP